MWLGMRAALSTIYALTRRHPRKAVFVALACAYWYRMQKQAKDVANKVVLITGGASGLGLLLAHQFSALGARVVLWDINEQALHEAGKAIAQRGHLVWTYTCNVADSAAVKLVAARVKNEVGKVDILINNAGIVSGTWITDTPSRRIERTFKVNVVSHFYTIKAFLPQMLDDDAGHIVTIASMTGTVGSARLTSFCSSKFAAVGLNESLRHELRARGKLGVKTTCVWWIVRVLFVIVHLSSSLHSAHSNISRSILQLHFHSPFIMTSGQFVDARTQLPLPALVGRFLWPALDPSVVASRIVRGIRNDDATIVVPSVLGSTIALVGGASALVMFF
jgi:NAD(P)-dependent dehydrogenase (short-subunit alcohol dehydrogenase family)